MNAPGQTLPSGVSEPTAITISITLDPALGPIGPQLARCLAFLAPADRPEGPCCDLHGRNCEPPSELCCRWCTEADHPRHEPGSECVLTAAPALRAAGGPHAADELERLAEAFLGFSDSSRRNNMFGENPGVTRTWGAAADVARERAAELRRQSSRGAFTGTVARYAREIAQSEALASMAGEGWGGRVAEPARGPEVPATSQKVPDLGGGPGVSPAETGKRTAVGHCGPAWHLGAGRDPLTWDGEKHEPHEWAGAAGDRVWCPGWPVQALDGQRPIVPPESRL